MPHSPRFNQDSHLKQACHDNHNRVEVGSSSHVPEEKSSNSVQGEMRFDDIALPREMKLINADNPTFEYISSGEEENILPKSANSNMSDSGSDLLAEESKFQQV
ncbi:unnamed protein product [Prunus armeniaca]|nr:unnamed protein product [Prunus armeniaca]